jgi:hypothetical protein
MKNKNKNEYKNVKNKKTKNRTEKSVLLFLK